MTEKITRNFTGGELSPALYARKDLTKYDAGLRTCRNFLIQRDGGIQNRPGSTFVCEVADSTNVVKTIPFIFSLADTCKLVFGPLTMRVIQNGAQIMDTNSYTVSAITNATPGVFTTSAPHGYSDGDEIVLSGIPGLPLLNGRNFKVVFATTSTFALTYMDTSSVNTLAMPIYAGGATVQRVYTLATPYAAADVPTIRYAQSNDVVYITHQNYPPQILSRTAINAWTIANASFEPGTPRPTGLTASSASVAISSTDTGNPPTVYAPNDLNNGDTVTIAGTSQGGLDGTWVVGNVTTGSFQLVTAPQQGSAGAGGTYIKTSNVQAQVYKMTAINSDTAEESLPALQAAKAITGMTAANPVVVTSAAHGYSNGDEILITGVLGMTEVNNQIFIVEGVTTNTYQLFGIDGSAYTAYISGGDAYRDMITLNTTPPTPITPNNISCNAVSVANEYFVYKLIAGTFAFLGVTQNAQFQDIGQPTNGTQTAPIFNNPFQQPGNYPSTVSFHQQRLAFASSINSPQTVWESQTGFFSNFTVSQPSQNSDSLTYTLAGQRVQAVLSLLEMGNLIIFTAGAEFAVEGDANGDVTPDAINVQQQTGHGSLPLPPINIDRTSLFIQARGSKVRDIRFNWQIDGYDGNDLTIFATHLFDGYSIVDWCYAQEPNSIVWACRNDGTLLGLTYIREQEIFGWHHHDTQGTYENCSSIPETFTENGSSWGEDVLYVVVQRAVVTNGTPRLARYIERFSSRLVLDQVDNVFVDAAYSFDGRQAEGSNNLVLTLTGASTEFAAYQELCLTSTTAFPSGIAAGDCIMLFDGNSDTAKVYRFTIGTVVDATHIYGTLNKTAPADMAAGNYITTWSWAPKTLNGMWALEGQTVSVLGDGFVVANPLNPQFQELLTVTNGSITLPQGYAVVHVGLSYESDMETLDMDTLQSETMLGKGKIVNQVTGYFWNTRGVFSGDCFPKNDPAVAQANFATGGYTSGLREMKIRRYESMDSPVDLFTGPKNILISPKWDLNGRICMRQVDPLPVSILAVAPTGLIPG